MTKKRGLGLCLCLVLTACGQSFPAGGINLSQSLEPWQKMGDELQTQLQEMQTQMPDAQTMDATSQNLAAAHDWLSLLSNFNQQLLKSGVDYSQFLPATEQSKKASQNP